MFGKLYADDLHNLTANISNCFGCTFSWSASPIPGTSFAQTQSVTVSPTTTTTYYVTVSNVDPVSGVICSDNLSVTVIIPSNLSTRCLPIIQEITQQDIDNAKLLNIDFIVPANSTRQVNSDLVFDDINFILEPNVTLEIADYVSIRLLNGSDFSIEYGGHLFSCNNIVWNGIIADGNSTISIVGSVALPTLIEDAATAIEIRGNNSRIYTNGVVQFNANNISIYAHDGDFSSSSFVNAQFTCNKAMDIPYHINPFSTVHVRAVDATLLHFDNPNTNSIYNNQFHTATTCLDFIRTNLIVDGCLFDQSGVSFAGYMKGVAAIKFNGAALGANTNDLFQCTIGKNNSTQLANRFENCFRGILSSGRAQVKIERNEFFLSNFGIGLYNNDLSNIPNKSGSIQISSNTFMNVLENGIDLMDNGNVTIQLVSNDFNMNMFNTTIPFDPASETRRGIYLHNSVDPNDDNSSLYIFNNRIMNCRTGIQIMQQQRGTVLQNDIFFQVPDNFIFSGPGAVFRRGLRAQNSNNINFNNNTVSRVPVNGQINTLSESMIDLTGIQGTLMCGFSEESSANNYTDNATIDLPTHFRIFDNCNASVFNCNQLSNGVEGFKLEGLNVQLGQQGASNNPCGNTWNNWPGAGSFNGYLRRIAGGQPVSADWWYGSTPEEDPSEGGNIQATPGIFPQLTGGQSCQPCVPCQTDRLYALLETLDSMMWDENTRFMAKQYIYEQIKDSLELLYSGSTHDIALQNFFSAMGLHNVGLLSSIDELLGSNDYANAILFNDDLIIAELVEANLETVNNICARYERRFDEMDSVDRASLEMIAYQNPSIGGVAVYRARAILGIDVDDTQLAFRVGRVDPVVNDVLINIIPNPASGRFYLSFNTKSDNLVSVSVSNILSQLVFPKVEFNMMESFEIDLSGNPAGLYFANIVLPDGKEVTKKLILINEK